MSYDPSDIVSPSPPRAIAQEPGWQRYESLITPERMKAEYLFGIPLKSALTKEEITDETITAFIVRAISETEHKTQIPITPVKYEDRYDYNLWDFQKYNFIQLNHWPVIQIESIKGKYPNAVDFIQYPKEWIALYNETGQFRLTPTNGQITQFFLTNDATYIPLILGSRADWPQLWQVTYTAGFLQDKIPAIVNDLIATIAAINLLAALAPVIFPYGGYAVGLDGVSQSVSTPGPAILTERIATLKEKKMELVDTIKRFYHHQLLFSVL